MHINAWEKERIIKECKFLTSRSSGPGGQNVNKVNTRIQLRFSVIDSNTLNEKQKFRIQNKLKSKISTEGFIQISVQETRSQIKNKQIAIELLFTMLEKSLIQPKKRIHTKPTRGSQVRRMDSKTKHGLKKSNRKKPML